MRESEQNCAKTDSRLQGARRRRLARRVHEHTSMSWSHVGTVILATFLASLVECVEALTIVLAVGTTRGWRSALTGAGAGALVLTALTLAAGPALQRIPLTSLQLVIGVLLLLFGMRWLGKAILRAGGVIGLHDESAIYAQETAALARSRDGDRVALVTAFKAVILEGLEVIFIVIAMGAHGLLVPAAAGAVLAGSLVILAGVALRRPLARVPENTLKFAVGVLLSAFGVFWLGEGLGYSWPGRDLALLGLIGAVAMLALLAVALIERNSDMRTIRTAVQGAAIALILVTGAIHFVDAPSSFGDAPYKGLLFVANGIAAVVAAFGIYRGRLWGWGLGVLVAGGALLGYAISRTVGLPGLAPEIWVSSPLAVLSLAVEAAFIVVFAESFREAHRSSVRYGDAQP
jgi:uncharacterized membrane protein